MMADREVANVFAAVAQVDGALQTGAHLAVRLLPRGSLHEGDVIHISGIHEIDSGRLRQFLVTGVVEDRGVTTLAIHPQIIPRGWLQTVTGRILNGAAIVPVPLKERQL